MFDLNEAISEWRSRMAAGGIDASSVLDELESHLREDMERRMRLGVDSRSAFTAAAQQLGLPAALKPEFEKVARPRKQILARWKSVVAGTLFAYSAVFITWLVEWRMGKIEITGTELALTLGSMLTTLLFGFMGRSIGARIPLVANEQKQAVFVLMAVFLGGASLRLLWNCLPFDHLVQAQVILLWTLSPLLGVGHCFSVWNDRCYTARKQIKA